MRAGERGRQKEGESVVWREVGREGGRERKREGWGYEIGRKGERKIVCKAIFHLCFALQTATRYRTFKANDGVLINSEDKVFSVAS